MATKPNKKGTKKVNDKQWRELNRSLLIATLLIGLNFALVLVPPVVAGLEFLFG
jgi:hypothetical protein